MTVSIRLRLALTYVALLVVATSALLAVSWWLLDRHLSRTLPSLYAEQVLGTVAAQYALAVAGSALVALGLGWLAAGRALAPVRKVAATARLVSERRLDARVRPAGAEDELHELGTAFDAMLDRVQGAVAAQRRFVANASHELRTPLTVMRAEADVALDDPDATVEQLREVARAVVEETDRTERLLEGLLVLSASTDGVRRDEPVALDVAARRAIASAGHGDLWSGRVAAEIAPVRVRGDDALLERLVGNLVENALRHGSGPVRVELRRSGDDAVLVVANGGEPIAPELADRLVQPFERLHRSRARGSGLGLSIVAAVAAAHGGQLELSAPAAGGLVVTVTLPAITGT